MATSTATSCIARKMWAIRQFRLNFAVTFFTTVSTVSLGQTSPEPQRMEPVTVSARSAPILDIQTADVGGFDSPIAKTPQSITVFGSDLLVATATTNLSRALKLDASLADHYNAAGYIESLSVRGFVLSQANNFRRNGLATSNYAPIALENKERIEILKGVSGLQAGVSAPGGLVNYVTKQPLRDRFSIAGVDLNQHGGTTAHLDYNTHFGRVGARMNVAIARERNHFDKADGHRALVSTALALPLSSATSIATEIEWHRTSQPSVPGVGLLDRDGDGVAETLPSPNRALQRLNLNNQSWSLPVESDTTQGSITLNHRINDAWNTRVALSHFDSRLNDRIAFPDGCANATNFVYPGLCGNGDVDIYDFRSDNERRRVSAFDAKLLGRISMANVEHRLQIGASLNRATTRTPPTSAYNYAGFTNIFSPIPVLENAVLESINTDSSERTFNGFFSMRSAWTESLTTYAGVAATRVSRQSVRSDGDEGISIAQTFTTPWIGIAYNPISSVTAYASYGEGIEFENVPNRPNDFTNFGAALSGLKSKQLELGLKWQINPRLLANSALFSIEKPFADDIENTTAANTANALRTRVAGGKLARHRGVEFAVVGRMSDALSIQTSATYLDARYLRAFDLALVGQRVTNVPRVAASIFVDYKIAAINGFSLNALLWSQSGKTATAYGDVSLPRAWQMDLGATFRTRISGGLVTTRLHVENVADRRYWREAPTTSWGGLYLFPSTPRTFKISVAAEF
jgi:iron complex outermembrane recepter protein